MAGVSGVSMGICGDSVGGGFRGAPDRPPFFCAAAGIGKKFEM